MKKNYRFKKIRTKTLWLMAMVLCGVLTANTSYGQTWRINSGGEAVTEAGSSYYTDVYSTGGEAKGDAATLYQSRREGPDFSYDFPVPNGTYEITLNFYEHFRGNTTKRMIDVSVEGTEELSDYDIRFEGGAKEVPIDTTLSTVTVSDGELNIRFVLDLDATTSDEKNAIVSGIEVKTVSLDAAVTTHALNTTATNGSIELFPTLPVSGVYGEGTEVILTAIPDMLYGFTDWAGDAAGTAETDTITMDAPKNVTANFALLPQHELTLTDVSGAVTLDTVQPAGGYFEGTVVTLTATTSELGYSVVWSGDTTSTENPLTIIMDSAINITATLVQQTSFATNISGPVYTAVDGTVYTSNQYFSGGNGNDNTTDPIAGAGGDDVLYQNGRWGDSSFDIPMANGTYDITLKFSESFWGSAGQRVFNVDVENTTAISNLDVAGEAGGNKTAFDTTIRVTLTDNELNIDFITVTDNAIINAIKVEQVAVEPVAVDGVELMDCPTVEINIGETVQLSAMVSPNDADDKNVSWTSSDPGVITVDESGLVTAIESGTATITVTTDDGDFTDVCIVTVATGVNVNLKEDALVEIFPNPASDVINIKLANSKKPSVIKIYNIEGKLLYTEEVTDLRELVRIKVDELIQIENYVFISIENGEKSYSSKVYIK